MTNEELSNYLKNKALKEIKELITQNPKLLPDIFIFLGESLKNYKDVCKKENDHLLREALGDALCLLGTKRKPDLETIKRFSIRIKQAIYPDGIKSFHHQGEKNFFEKYLKE